MNQQGPHSQTRAQVLAKIRKSLQVKESEASRNAATDRRIAEKPRAAAPQRVSASGTDLNQRFIEELQRQLATVLEVPGASGIPQAIAEYLKSNNQPLRLRHGKDAYLNALNFSGVAGIEALSGRAQPDDTAGLSTAFAGIAETGTMALLSGAENPVTLGFIPDTHIIVVPRSRIVATFEDVFALLRDERGPQPMPRTLNMITGPSRTADIGGRIVIGAHGPRRLLAIVAGDL